MHSVFLAAILSSILYVIVSFLTNSESGTANNQSFTWVGLGVFTRNSLRAFGFKLLTTLSLLAILGYCLWKGISTPVVLASLGALWTWVMFITSAMKSVSGEQNCSLIKNDRVWGGLLAACAVFMLFYFK